MTQADDRDTIKPRRCLGCPREFMSQHAGNRICPRCARAKDKGLERRRIAGGAGEGVFGGVRVLPRVVSG